MAGDTTAREFIFAALIFSAILTGSLTLIGLSLPTSSTEYSQYNTTFNKFESIKTNADSTAEVVEDFEAKSGPLGILEGLIQAGWGAIKQVWTSFGTLSTISTQLSNGAITTFSLPTWFTGLIITMIAVTIAFAFLAAIFKWYI